MSSTRRWKYRVRHLLEAIEKIQRYTANLQAKDLDTNPLVLDAVLRNFQVIGEAARRVPGDIQQRHPKIPWSEMQRMRHVVVHDYDRVDTSVVWQTIQQDLPPLIEPLNRLLQEPEA